MRERRTEMQWSLGPTTVYGTLVMPPGSGPFPGVVMVAGSGPTDAIGTRRYCQEPAAVAVFLPKPWPRPASPHCAMTRESQGLMPRKIYSTFCAHSACGPMLRSSQEP